MKARELFRWRKERGYTQESLARELGVNSRTLAHWEKGTRPMHPLLPRAVRALEVELVEAEPEFKSTELAPSQPEPQPKEKEREDYRWKVDRSVWQRRDVSAVAASWDPLSTLR